MLKKSKVTDIFVSLDVSDMAFKGKILLSFLVMLYSSIDASS
jgi:hypothetical protein